MNYENIAFSAAERGLEKLKESMKTWDQNELIHQDSIGAVFTFAELEEAVENVKYISDIEFDLSYDDFHELGEDYTEIFGADQCLIYMETREEIEEGIFEFISTWLESNVSYALKVEHNDFVYENLARL